MPILVATISAGKIKALLVKLAPNALAMPNLAIKNKIGKIAES